MYIKNKNNLNFINMKKLHKIHFFKIITIFFIIFILVACKKRHPDEFREPFTEEQMGWINNLENPKYKRVVKITDSTGDTILKVDTLIAQTRQIIFDRNDVMNDEYIIFYYTGYYECGLGKIDETDLNLSFYSTINTENQYDFVARLYDYYGVDLLKVAPDTAMINGKLYNDVYKMKNCQYNYKYIYFKKNLGFLYLEKLNGNNATIIN